MASANIFQSYLQPPRSIAEYSGDLDKQEANALELMTKRRTLVEGQQSMAEKNALRDYLRGGGELTTPEGIKRGYQVAPTLVGPIIKQQSEIAASKATADMNTQRGQHFGAQTTQIQQGVAQKQHEEVIKYITMMNSPETAISAIHAQVAAGKLPPDKAQGILQTIPQDPAKYPAWRAKALSWLMSAKDQVGQIEPTAGQRLTATTSTANNAATNQTSRQNNQANIDAQAPYRQSQVRRNDAETADIPPVPVGGGQPAPVAPQAVPTTPQSFPRAVVDADQTQVAAQKYLRDPQELARLDQSIEEVKAGLRTITRPEQGGILRRELQAMQLAKQIASGQTQASPAASMPAGAPIDREINSLSPAVNAETRGNPVAALAAPPQTPQVGNSLMKLVPGIGGGGGGAEGGAGPDASPARVMPQFVGRKSQRDAAKNAWLAAQDKADLKVTLLGANESSQLNRVLAGGSQTSAALANISKLPISSSSGLFGGRVQGKSLFEAGKETLANTMTTQEVQTYNVLTTGIQRSMAAIESMGLAPTNMLMHMMGNVIFKEGDTYNTKIIKLAETRQVVEAAFRIVAVNPRVSPQQKAEVEKILSEISKSVPFTVEQALELQILQTKNPNATLNQVMKESKSRTPATGLSPAEETRYQELLKKQNATK